MKKIIVLSILCCALLAMGVYAACDATGLYDCSSFGGDTDSDGVCDDWESGWYGTDKFAADTDSGGACDGDELFFDITDPTQPDDDIA